MRMRQKTVYDMNDFIVLSHLPLHVVGEGLVCLLQQGPVTPTQGEGHRRQTEQKIDRKIKNVNLWFKIKQ